MMKSFRWSILLVFVFLVGCNMSGCGRGIFNTEPFTDMTKDEHGQSIAADTQRNWREFQWDIDPQIEEERMGKPAPGFQTWNEKWVRSLMWIGKTQENAPKYIAYIIESRRQAGLPELEGYPP